MPAQKEASAALDQGVDTLSSSPEREASLQERRQQIIDRVHSYMHYTFNELGAASKQQTEELRSGLVYIKTEDDIRGWERMCETTLPRLEQSAHKLYHNEMMDKLLDAYNGTPRAISLSGIARWDRRFRDPTVDYKKKEAFIRSTLPGYMANWKAVAGDRRHALAAAKRKGLDLKSIEGLAPLLDETAFLDADYDVRKGLVAKLQSYLSSKDTGMEGLWKNTQQYLVSLTAGDERCLHRSKVGTWLKRIFTGATTPKEVDAYMQHVVEPAVSNWKEVSAKYDVLFAAGLPPSFNAVSKDRFLGWHYDKRVAYVEALEHAQQAAEEKENTAFNDQKKEIRYDLSAEDFDEAETKLLPLLKEFPADPDLRSMERYLTHHRPMVEIHEEQEEKETEAAKLQEELGMFLGMVPASMRWMYLEAMQDGPVMLRRLQQIIYNRKWANDSGYTNRNDETKQATSEVNKQDTQTYVKEGHTDGFERIVMDGDTARHTAIRDECKQAQVLYVSAGECRAVVDKVRANKESGNFGYWTTLVLTDVAYDVQANVITNLHYPLISRLRKLHALGERFNPAGA